MEARWAERERMMQVYADLQKKRHAEAAAVVEQARQAAIMVVGHDPNLVTQIAFNARAEFLRTHSWWYYHEWLNPCAHLGPVS